MQKTNFEGYESASSSEMDTFLKQWINSNRHGIYTVLKNIGDSFLVEAYDKETNKLHGTIKVAENEVNSYEMLQKNFVSKPFKCRFVAKPSERVFFILPKFEDKEDTNKLLMLKDNIMEATVISLYGANDINIIATVKDDKGNEYSAVQESIFSSEKDAIRACSLMPKGGWSSWEEYQHDVSYLTEYKYQLNIPYKYGDTISCLGSRALRIVVSCLSESRVQVDIQCEPLVRLKGKYIRLTEMDEEVKVEAKLYSNDILSFENYYKGCKVDCIVRSISIFGTYDTYKNEYFAVDKRKLQVLKAKIEKKRVQLLDNYAHAQGSGDNITAEYVKKMELQCCAELRLIRCIEQGLDVDDFTIC